MQDIIAVNINAMFSLVHSRLSYDYCYNELVSIYAINDIICDITSVPMDHDYDEYILEKLINIIPLGSHTEYDIVEFQNVIDIIAVMISSYISGIIKNPEEYVSFTQVGDMLLFCNINTKKHYKNEHSGYLLFKDYESTICQI